MDVFDALGARRSVRAFRPEPVPEGTLRRVFEAAQRAPSWCNVQPWRVYVATGPRRERLVSALERAAKEAIPTPDIAFPDQYPEPYGAHRRACGKALYDAMGVAREDKAARYAAWLRNFRAFDAPHVAVVAMDPRFREFGAIDVGAWLMALMLAAEAEGIATCAQASVASYPSAIRDVVPVPTALAILFGVAIGYEDERAAVNRCRTARAPIEEQVHFYDTP